MQFNVGIINANPGTDEGVTTIMEKLQDYTPWSFDSRGHVIPFAIPCHGDGLSHERMVNAQFHRQGNPDAKSRLQGLEAVPQEFHHRGLILQVCTFPV